MLAIARLLLILCACDYIEIYLEDCKSKFQIKNTGRDMGVVKVAILSREIHGKRHRHVLSHVCMLNIRQGDIWARTQAALAM